MVEERGAMSCVTVTGKMHCSGCSAYRCQREPVVDELVELEPAPQRVPRVGPVRRLWWRITGH
jgi:hypothetical protein